MNKEYIKYLRERQGSTSVGPSTARGMGPKGTIQAARKYLQALRLKRFIKKSNSAFLRELDMATEELMAALPKRARKWGSSRKFLNIFLRGCTYNKYLNRYYSLGKIEQWLEVPLDSHVIRGLKNEAERGQLPSWTGVINLKPSVSMIFQNFATEVARREGVLRVHLDVKYWRRIGELDNRRSKGRD